MKLIPRNLQIFSHVYEHNWLIHCLMIDFLTEAASKYAFGSLVDIACGKKPYLRIFAPYVSRHIGMDLAQPSHGTPTIDVIGSAYHTSFPDSLCDVVLCTEVLEHLEEPLAAVKEMNRILKHQGVVILTVPFFWHIHDPPRDYYRFSKFGLRYLFENAGFEIVEIRPLTGYIVTFAQLSIYFLRSFKRGCVLRTAGRFFNWTVQHLALKLNRYDKSTNFTNLYGLVARKIKEV